MLYLNQHREVPRQPIGLLAAIFAGLLPIEQATTAAHAEPTRGFAGAIKRLPSAFASSLRTRLWLPARNIEFPQPSREIYAGGARMLCHSGESTSVRVINCCADRLRFERVKPPIVHSPGSRVTNTVARQKGALPETPRRVNMLVDTRVCLYAGEISREQGLATLIEAARLAHADPRDASLLFILVGEGTQREALRETSAELSNVLCLPTPREGKISDLLDLADMLILIQRPFGGSNGLDDQLALYLASGRPIIASVNPAGHIAARLREAGAGIVVEPGNPAALLSAVRRLTDEPELAARFAANARHHASLCQ